MDLHLLAAAIGHAGAVLQQRKAARAGALQDAQLRAQTDQIANQGKYQNALDVQKLQNQGGLAEAQARGTGQLDVQQLRNELGLALQNLKGTTALDVEDKRTDRALGVAQTRGEYTLDNTALGGAWRKSGIDAQQAGATSRADALNTAKEHIATGNNALKDTVSKRAEGTKVLGIKTRAKTDTYRANKTAATQRFTSGQRLEGQEYAADTGADARLEAARIQAQASVRNTQAQVDARLRTATTKPGAKTAYRSAQLKAWQTELDSIAKAISNPLNFKTRKGVDTMNKLMARRKAIMDQILAVSDKPDPTGPGRTATATPTKKGRTEARIAGLQDQIFAKSVPASPAKKAAGAIVTNRKRKGIGLTPGSYNGAMSK